MKTFFPFVLIIKTEDKQVEKECKIVGPPLNSFIWIYDYYIQKATCPLRSLPIRYGTCLETYTNESIIYTSDAYSQSR